jgi:hypothetical protein
VTDELVHDFLEHHGVKGMKWGVRKKEDSTGWSNKKKAAVIFGSAAAVTALAVGAVYAKKHFGVSTSNISKPAEATKKFAESMAAEPIGIVHASRGQSVRSGFTFPQRGGLSNPLAEYDKAGLQNMAPGSFKRYGDRNEKVAAIFLDPLGRKDQAGRIIPHEVVLPEDLAKGLHTNEDVVSKIWPIIKDVYEPFYKRHESSNSPFGPGY